MELERDGQGYVVLPTDKHTARASAEGQRITGPSLRRQALAALGATYEDRHEFSRLFDSGGEVVIVTYERYFTDAPPRRDA